MNNIKINPLCKKNRLLKTVLIAGTLLLAFIISGCSKVNKATPEGCIARSFTVSPEQLEFAENSSDAKIAVLIAKNTKYKILSSDNNTYTLSITAPDMAELLYSVVDDSAIVTDPQAEYSRIADVIIKALENGKFQKCESIVSLQVIMKDGEFELVPTPEFVDAKYGGMMSLLNELSKESV